MIAMAIDLRIELDDANACYTPGSQLLGRIVWGDEHSPREIVGYLSWQTHGKGDKDSETLIEQHWTPQPGVHFVKFNWVVPRAPLSLNGSIINIQWVVEAESTKPSGTTSRLVHVGYSAQPIALQSIT